MKIPSPHTLFLVALHMDEFDEKVGHTCGDDSANQTVKEHGLCIIKLRHEVLKAKPVIQKIKHGEPLTVEEEEIKIRFFDFIMNMEFEFTEEKDDY